MDFMENRLSKFKSDIADQFGHNVFYNNVLYAYFIICWKKRINTRILFLMTTYRRVLIIKLLHKLGTTIYPVQNRLRYRIYIKRQRAAKLVKIYWLIRIITTQKIKKSPRYLCNVM